MSDRRGSRRAGTAQHPDYGDDLAIVTAPHSPDLLALYTVQTAAGEWVATGSIDLLVRSGFTLRWDVPIGRQRFVAYPDPDPAP